MAVGRSESAARWQFAEVQWWWPLRRHGRYLAATVLSAVAALATLLAFQGPLFETTAIVEIKAGMAYPDPSTSFLEHHRALASAIKLSESDGGKAWVDITPGASLLAIHYRAEEPSRARDGANHLANAFVALMDRMYDEELARAALLLQRKLDRALDAPLELRDATRDDYDREGGLVMSLPGFVATGVSNGPLQDALVAQLVESYDQSLAQLPTARLLSAAMLPEAPVWRIHPAWALALGLLVLVFAAGALVLRFRYRNTLDFPADIEAVLGLPCLAWFPLIADGGKEVAGHAGGADDKALDAALSACRHALRTAICMLEPVREVFELQPQGRVVLVTSGRAGDGTSTVARNLALGLTGTEKVLLINADMRGESSCCDLPVNAPGLSHLIAGAAQMRDCIHTSSSYGFDIIPAGVLPPDPAMLLAGKRFKRVLGMLQRRYDLIVIDTPPLENTQDALLLARHCDDLVYVVAAGALRSGAAAHLQHLTTSGIAVAGMVMNRLPSSLQNEVAA